MEPLMVVAGTPSRTAMHFTTSDVVLDANVLVGLIDRTDSQHARATTLAKQLRSAGKIPVLLDFLVEEAVAVLARRSRERKSNGPDLEAVIAQIRAWYDQGQIESMTQDLEGCMHAILDVVSDSGGSLNPNDAKLVLLQRLGAIGEIATFDARLAAFPSLFVCSL